MLLHHRRGVPNNNADLEVLGQVEKIVGVWEQISRGTCTNNGGSIVDNDTNTAFGMPALPSYYSI